MPLKPGGGKPVCDRCTCCFLFTRDRRQRRLHLNLQPLLHLLHTGAQYPFPSNQFSIYSTASSNLPSIYYASCSRYKPARLTLSSNLVFGCGCHCWVNSCDGLSEIHCPQQSKWPDDTEEFTPGATTAVDRQDEWCERDKKDEATECLQDCALFQSKQSIMN